jgi:hypothetical protein
MNKVYIVMAGGGTWEGNYEYLVKVFADKTEAELLALELNELSTKAYEAFAAEDFDKRQVYLDEIKKLDEKYSAGYDNSYNVDEHIVN